MTPLTFHPLADIFPLLEGEEFDALVADIQASGLHEPIRLYEDQILDGRNRYRACQALGLDCATQLYTGDDPVGFVISRNVRRRHLDESQRAMVGARLATLPRGANQHAETSAPTQHEAATLLHVSSDSIQTARKVQREGVQEIIDAVDAGKIAVSAAVHLTALPHEDQLTALQEAQHEATGNKPTAKQTRTVVRRRQGSATITAEGEGHTKDAKATRAALPKRLSQLFELLEELATISDLEQLLLDIPSDCYDRVDHDLDTAFKTLRRLKTLWQKYRLDAPVGLGQPRTPQRVRQSAKGKTRRKTKQTQPALILKAIRTALQPLTIKDLRQRPSVNGRRLKHNIARLVAQGKIEERTGGTFCSVR
jgi:ParB-like chromosome segregation protein Spo0J